MPRHVRSGVKHGGVTGATRPNSYKTNIIPGANPRGDGKLKCGHPATKPERWLARKTPRWEWDTDARRVCEACFETTMADPDTIWKEADNTDQALEPESELQRENRELRVLANVLLRRLKARPDWPLIQKLAALTLAVERMLNSKNPWEILELVSNVYMDPEIQQFMVTMDRLNLLPDGHYARLRAIPTDLTPNGILRTTDARLPEMLRLRDDREVEHALIAQANGEPYSEAAKMGVKTT